MLSPQEVKQKAEKWWNDGSFLTAWLNNEGFFPKEVTQIGLVKPSETLVNFDKTFVNEILEPPQFELLKSKNKGYKFASQLVEGMTIVAPEINTKFLKEYDIANVYAFDCLIFNIFL